MTFNQTVVLWRAVELELQGFVFEKASPIREAQTPLGWIARSVAVGFLSEMQPDFLQKFPSLGQSRIPTYKQY